MSDPKTPEELAQAVLTADQLRAGQSVDVTPDAADDSIAGQIVAGDPPQHSGSKK